MSSQAKLTATEPNPNKPRISPGRKAGKAIVQAIELPAAQVRAEAVCTNSDRKDQLLTVSSEADVLIRRTNASCGRCSCKITATAAASRRHCLDRLT